MAVTTSIGDQNSDLFILGVKFQDRKQLGFALQKLDVIRKQMEKEMENVIFNKLSDEN